MSTSRLYSLCRKGNEVGGTSNLYRKWCASWWTRLCADILYGKLSVPKFSRFLMMPFWLWISVAARFNVAFSSVWNWNWREICSMSEAVFGLRLGLVFIEWNEIWFGELCWMAIDMNGCGIYPRHYTQQKSQFVGRHLVFCLISGWFFHRKYEKCWIAQMDLTACAWLRDGVTVGVCRWMIRTVLRCFRTLPDVTVNAGVLELNQME